MAKRSTRPTAAVNMTARRDAAATVGNDNQQEDPTIAKMRERALRIFETRGAHGVQHTLGAAALAFVPAGKH